MKINQLDSDTRDLLTLLEMRKAKLQKYEEVIEKLKAGVKSTLTIDNLEGNEKIDMKFDIEDLECITDWLKDSINEIENEDVIFFG